jgi:hypothetical protein
LASEVDQVCFVAAEQELHVGLRLQLRLGLGLGLQLGLGLRLGLRLGLLLLQARKEYYH